MGFDKTTASVSETPEGRRKKWLKWPAKKPKGRQLDAGSTPSLSIKSSSTVSIYDPERELGEATDGKSLWDRAYDALRNDDPKLVSKYEKLLSTELSRIESKALDDLGSQPDANSYEIDNVINHNNLAQRRTQLDKIVENGAKKLNSPEHHLREAADKTASLVLWAKGIIDEAVKASPEASMAWAGISIVLPLLTNPSVADHANREGFAYVTSRMKYYVAFEPLLLRTSAVVPRDLMTEYKKLIADLYKHILEFQLRSVLRLYNDCYKNFARDIIQPSLWDELKSAITNREQLLSNGLMQINTVVSTNTQQDHLSEANQSRKLLSQLVDNLREYSQEQQLADEAKCRQLFLLLTGQRDESYGWYKDRIEDRVAGTCNWVLQHENFQSWSEQDSGLMILSADPGCGKSVLAKYLIDSQLPRSSTICYFFFKDQDQNTIRQALCALLHQLLVQKPELIRHAMPEYKLYEEKLVHLTPSLWRILEDASKDPDAGSIIFVLDALDECKEVDFKDLVSHLMDQFQQSQQESSKVKFLLTTRPYREVLSEFRELVNSSPHIRIPGEDDSETIAKEVNEVIKYRVDQLAKDIDLSDDMRDHLELKLLTITHRTYLWVHLVFDYLKSKDFKRTKKGIESAISSLPESVAEAYDRILSRSKDNKMVLKALSMILAARRPLSLSEMNVAINVDSSSTSTEGLDLETDKDFKERLRSWCGLFISVYDESVYFIHQTAREFLLSSLSMPPSLSSTPAPLHWQGSISIPYAESVLAEVCITYLMLLDSPDIPLSEDNVIETENINNYGFTRYSARYWISHFQEALRNDEALLSSIFRICDPSSQSFAVWHTMDINQYFLYEQNLTTLMVVAYFKNEILVKRLLETKESNIEFRGNLGINTKTVPSDLTALTWASVKGNAAIFKLLLEDSDVDINLQGYRDYTPLQCAFANDHMTIVGLLLLHADKFGVKLKDDDDRSPLIIAIWYGHELEVIACKIIQNGRVDINSRNPEGKTPLALAAMFGRESIVWKLLETGEVDVDARTNEDATPLGLAATNGHEAICQMLLGTGKVDVDAKNKNGSTPLALATMHGRENTVRMLLETGEVDVDAKTNQGLTPLALAARRGYAAICQMLLDTGKVDVDSRDVEGRTPLSIAAEFGNEAIVDILLYTDKVDVDSRDDVEGRTPLSIAAGFGHEAIVDILLCTNKVDVDSRDVDGRTPLSIAAEFGHEAIVNILLRTNTVNIDSRDVEGRTPLSIAAEFGREAVVDILLRTNKVNINSKSITGASPLSWAAANGHIAVVDLLTNTGEVNIDSKDEKGATALSLAAINEHREVVELLLSAGEFRSIQSDESTRVPNNEPPKLEHDANDTIINTARSGTDSTRINRTESTEIPPLQAENDG